VEAELVDVLRKIDDSKLYREYGATSLFVYATQVLKLSESVAWNFITVSRATKTAPALKEAISNGELSVSKARRITSVLALKNQSEASQSLWVEKAKTLTQRELEKAVAKENPQVLVPEKASYVAEELMKLELGMSEEELKELRYVQDLICQSKQKAVSLKDALVEMAKFYKQHKDPVEKAKRARRLKADRHAQPTPDSSQVGHTSKTATNHEQSLVSHVVPALPEEEQSWLQETWNEELVLIGAARDHAVARRDGYQCTAINPNGKRCSHRRWLDVHHIKPRHQGGTDSLSNLTTLCKGHHQLHHWK
jgi:hypothetical protein